MVVVVGGGGGQGKQAWPREMRVAMESVRASFIVPSVDLSPSTVCFLITLSVFIQLVCSLSDSTGCWEILLGENNKMEAIVDRSYGSYI